MKILFLSTYDNEGGAGRAANRLYRGLRDIGVDTEVLTLHKSGPDPHVHPFFKGADPARPVLGSVLKRASAESLVFFDRAPRRRYRQRDTLAWTVGWLPTRTPQGVARFNPRVIHLHWVGNGFVSIHAVRSFNVPVVWTLHDMWTFTGGCHYALECDRYQEACGQCPQLNSQADRDLSRWTWLRKNKQWNNHLPTIICLSHWMAGCARQSALLRDARIEVIHNGIDLNRFKAIDQTAARHLFSLPLDKKVILFGAVNSTSNRLKGFQYLQGALKRLAAQGWGDRAELVVFGDVEPRNNAPDFGMKTRYLGSFDDEQSVVALYSAVDVFLAPAVQDNLPNTVLEALACSRPSVAFSIGGLPDLIDHQQNGYLAQPFDVDDFAAGISWVLADEHRWQKLAAAARQKAERTFEIAMIAHRHRALYEDLLKQ